MATVFAVVSWSCSDDDNSDTVTLIPIGLDLKYIHEDLDQLPLPVQEALKDYTLDNLSYVIKGSFKGRETYMFDHIYSSSLIGRAVYADGTLPSGEEIEKAYRSGKLNNWICIYHFLKDRPLDDAGSPEE